MPTLRTLFKRFVIALFVLFNQALQTDVTSSLVSELIKLEKQQKTRYGFLGLDVIGRTPQVKVIDVHSCVQIVCDFPVNESAILNRFAQFLPNTFA